jgi:hypothetical protein
MNKRLWSLAFATALGLCLVAPRGPALAQAPAAPGAPRIEFVATAFDFGQVYEGQQVGHRFRFRNTGNADLHVGPLTADYVRAFCALPGALSVAGPSSAPAEATSVISPGQWGEIVATFNSEGFAVPGFDGKILQHVNVYSDDLSHPRVRLELSGRVQAVMIPDPPMVALGTVYRDKADGGLPTHLASVVVTPTPGHSFSVISAESNSPFFLPTVAPASGGTGGFVVTTEIDPAIPNGELKDAYVRIHTTHPNKPVLTIPVAGAVMEARPIVASPSIAQFGLVKAGEERSITLKLAKGETTNWQLLRAEAEVEGAPMRASFRRLGPDYEVTLTVKASTEAFSGFSGRLVLTTDDTRKPLVTVPVRGWVYAEEPFALPPDALKGFVSRVLRDELFPRPEEVLTKVLAGARDERALDALVAALRNDNWFVKMRAAILLGRLGNAGAVEALEAAARSDVDEDVREEAMVTLARIAPDRALPYLLRGLRDEDSWVRERVASVLGEMGDRRAVPALLQAMRDKDEDVAVAAANSVDTLVRSGK